MVYQYYINNAELNFKENILIIDLKNYIMY